MGQMTFARIAAMFSDPSAAAPWAEGWEDSQATYPGKPLEIFDADRLRRSCDLVGLAGAPREALLEHVSVFAADDRLCRLAWHLFRRLVESPGMLEAGVRSWPMLPAETVPGADLFYAYLFLACTERIKAWYDRRGIPPEIFRETMGDLERWMRTHRDKTGHWGFSEHKWLVQHFSGNLFQLGRLQFQFGVFRHPYHAWRHRHTGAVILLAGAELRFDRSGLVASTDPGLPLGAAYIEDDAAVSGLPIDPRGGACAEAIRLSRSAWDKRLSPGDAVLNIHIPAGSPMAIDLCGESFRRALEFFPRHFPDFASRAFVCGSWLLDPHFENYLKPESNIVRFLREVYLFPLPGAGAGAPWSRVFGAPVVDLATAPRDTSLRRAILDHMQAGGEWRSGGCLLFPEDVEHWGRQIYRRVRAPVQPETLPPSTPG